MSFLLIENIFNFIKTLNSSKSNSSLLYDNCFNCFCKQQISLDLQTLKNHISQCRQYKTQSPFQKDFSQLPMNLFQVVHLLALKAEFLNFLDIVEEYLRKKGYTSSQQGSKIKSSSQISQQSSPKQIFQELKIEKQNTVLSSYSRSPQVQQQQQEKNYRSPLSLLLPKQILKCGQCMKQFDSQFDNDQIINLKNCSHQFCRDCFQNQITNQFTEKSGNLECQICFSPIDGYEIQDALGKEMFEILSAKLIEQNFQIIKCSHCNQIFEFEEGVYNDLNIIDPKTNKQLNESLIEHYNKNRFICSNCRQEQCRSCHVMPYHIGYDCQQYAKQKEQYQCRFCKEPFDQINSSQICLKSDCQEKLKYSCPKKLICGHMCNGFINEKNCFQCLHVKCSLNQCDEFCSICQCETLSQAPCIQSNCGHIFHYSCILKRLQTGRQGNKLIFNFCLCPLCVQWLSFEKDSEPQKLIEQNYQLNELLKKKSLKRLIDEGRDKDEQLVDQKSFTNFNINKIGQFYNKPLEYSLQIYQYFLCFKCQLPYFAGLIDCQIALQDQNQEQNPEDLICPQCCCILPQENCELHGLEYIAYKCRFCCSIAIYYCWGTTHFCQSCHNRQCKGDYVTNIPKEKLPKCLGKGQCPLKIDHKPNGEEYALGCYLCNINH